MQRRHSMMRITVRRSHEWNGTHASRGCRKNARERQHHERDRDHRARATAAWPQRLAWQAARSDRDDVQHHADQSAEPVHRAVAGCTRWPPAKSWPHLEIPKHVGRHGIRFVEGWVTGIDADAQHGPRRRSARRSLRHTGLCARQHRRRRGGARRRRTRLHPEQRSRREAAGPSAVRIGARAPSWWPAAASPASSQRRRSPSSTPNYESSC